MDNKDIINALTKRLAELLQSEEASQLITTLQLIKQSFRPQKAMISKLLSPKVGIWEFNKKDKLFKRSIPLKNEWRYWADSKEITFSKTAYRIILIGESTARAYLYDPVITLSTIIQEYLRHHIQCSGLNFQFEFIDLARTDINQFELVDLLEEIDILNPDFIILFAGSNWLNFGEYSQADIQKIIDNAQDPLVFSRSYFENEILPRSTGKIVERFNDVCSQAKKMIVIPEFNLRNWQNEEETFIPIRNYKNPELLFELRSAIVEKSGQQKWNEVIRFCDDLIDITEGTSSFPYFFKGSALRKSGLIEESLICLKKAKDAGIGIPIRCSPRCLTAVQLTLKDMAAQMNIPYVDIPALFKEKSVDGIPGTDLFLDYCHFNLRGLHFVAGAIASNLFKTIFNKSPIPVDLYHSDNDYAATYLLAAIHNAHHGQNEETIKKLIKRALELDENFKETLIEYIKFQASASPRWLHASFAKLSENRMIERYLYPRNPHEFDKFADFKLFNCIAQLVTETKAQQRQLLQTAVSKNPPKNLDLLLDRFARATFLQKAGFTLGDAPIFFRERKRVSRFYIPLFEPKVIKSKLVARIPQINIVCKNMTAILCINNQTVKTFELSHEWQVFQFEVKSGYFKTGINKIQLEWPLSYPDFDVFRYYFVTDLIEQRAPDVLPVFGEIFSFNCQVDEPPHILPQP